MSIPPLPEGMPSNQVNEVANGLHSAAIHLLRSARPADLETGLSPERLSLLSVLVYAGPQSLGRLAEIEQVSRPAISRMTTALSEAGLIRTERSETDRRSVTASATREGRELMEAGRRGRLRRITALLEPLGSEELEILDRAAELLDRATSEA